MKHMIFIPGWVMSLFTFPGVIVHEWAHKLFCNRMEVPVHKVVYFRIGNPAGFVLHDIPKTYAQTFWISIGPLLVNSVGAILLGALISPMSRQGWLFVGLAWLAFSIGMNSFPSDQDMQHIWYRSKSELKKGGSVLHYLSFVLVAVVWVANKLRIVWFDVLYAYLLIKFGMHLL